MSKSMINGYFRSPSRKYGILFIACVLFHLIGTWSLPLIDRDEPRFAEASREMIQRHNYAVPFFNNDYRFDKPPLTYWAQMASYRIFGQNDFAARFPSAVAAALVALSLLAWGSRIGGEKIGWWAAIIFTLSLQTFVHAKAAVADMWLVLFMTLAFWAGYELIGERKTLNPQRSEPDWHTPSVQWKWWLVFYVSLALAFLAKGPIGFMPLLAVVIAKWQDPELRLWRRFAFTHGLAITFVLIALWAIPAFVQTGGEFWRVGLGKHVVGRSLGAMEGHGAKSLGMYFLMLPFYLVTVFASFFPWSIKLPWLMRKYWTGQRSAVAGPSVTGIVGYNVDAYLFGGIAIVFIIFTLVGTKLPHYTLPAFPLLSLLLARHWSQQPAIRFKGIAISMACSLFVLAAMLPPLVAPLFPAYALFRASRDFLRPEMEFGANQYSEASLVWYFRSRINGFMTTPSKREAPEFMSKTGPRFVIMPTESVDAVFPNRPAAWKTFSTQGFNIARGKRVDLTLVLKSE